MHQRTVRQIAASPSVASQATDIQTSTSPRVIRRPRDKLNPPTGTAAGDRVREDALAPGDLGDDVAGGAQQLRQRAVRERMHAKLDIAGDARRPAARVPLHQRNAHLKKLIADTDVQFSESVEVDGREMCAHACKVGLEGVVSKVRDRRYVSGRVNDWVKTTCASARPWPSPASRSTATTGTATSSAGARARTWSTPARSTTASTRGQSPICASG
jgi:hypothetical protein